jgi:amino acid transporter
MKILGIVLIVLGIISFAYQGISFTKKEKIIDIGPIEATKEEKKTIPLPPILGGLLVAGGIILLVTGSRKTT